MWIARPISFLSKIVALPIIAAANGFAPGNAEVFARGDGVSAAGDGTSAGALKGEGCPGNTGREGGAIPMGNGDCIPAAAIPNIAAAAAEVGTPPWGGGSPSPAPTGAVDVLGDPNAALGVGVGVLVTVSRGPVFEVSESESLTSGERLIVASLLSSRDVSRGLGVDVLPLRLGGVPVAALGAGYGRCRKGAAPCCWAMNCLAAAAAVGFNIKFRKSILSMWDPNSIIVKSFTQMSTLNFSVFQLQMSSIQLDYMHWF